MMLIFLTLVGAALLGLVVVVIYLNDRVNELERRTSPGGSGGGGSGGDDGTWRGLSGKRLWDVMTGKSGGPALEPTALEALRSSYEDVLSKHIESLFKAGQADARKGASAQPTSVKSLASPRGTVQSWIPLNHANALYRAGHDSVKDDIYETERVRMALDETTQILYAQTHLPLAQPFSDLLMPLPSSGDPGEEPASLGQTGATAGPATPQLATAAAVPPALPGSGPATALGAATPPGATASGGGMFAASAPAAPKPPGSTAR